MFQIYKCYFMLNISIKSNIIEFKPQNNKYEYVVDIDVMKLYDSLSETIDENDPLIFFEIVSYKNDIYSLGLIIYYIIMETNVVYLDNEYQFDFEQTIHEQASRGLGTAAQNANTCLLRTFL